MNRVYDFLFWATITALVIALMTPAIANGESSKGKENVVYKYKQYEFIDLSNMKVNGRLAAPGDISVKKRERRHFKRQLFNRKHFKRNMVRDIKTLR